MGWASRAPDVIEGLVALFRGDAAFQDVLVMDGPEVTTTTAVRVLTVGWSAVDGETAVEAQVVPEGMGGNPDREQFTIRCTAAVIDGSTKVALVRRAAYDLMSAAGAAIAGNRELGGAMRLQMGGHRMMTEQIRRGVQALLVFDVDVDAYTAV